MHHVFAKILETEKTLGSGSGSGFQEDPVITGPIFILYIVSYRQEYCIFYCILYYRSLNEKLQNRKQREGPVKLV